MRKLLSLRKNKKGFTMVELLVVLVIIVILMAAIIPSMLGFIDKAKEESILAECRNVQLATDVALNELYGTSTAGTVTVEQIMAKVTEIEKIAGVDGFASSEITSITIDSTGKKVATISYKASNGKGYTFTNPKWAANT